MTPIVANVTGERSHALERPRAHEAIDHWQWRAKHDMPVDQRHFTLAQADAQLRQPHHDAARVVLAQVVAARQRARLGIEIGAAQRGEAPHQNRRKVRSADAARDGTACLRRWRSCPAAEAARRARHGRAKLRVPLERSATSKLGPGSANTSRSTSPVSTCTPSISSTKCPSPTESDENGACLDGARAFFEG